MATRLCASCQQEKTIRGVWYLTPTDSGSPFLCESCFRGVPAAPVSTAPTIEAFSGLSG